jgi:imidazolonepropionase-like amidohydrolase
MTARTKHLLAVSAAFAPLPPRLVVALAPLLFFYAAAVLLPFSAASARAEVVAFTNATVHPGRSGTMNDAMVIIDGDRVLDLGDDVSPPPGARIVDCTGKHIYPGLVSAHTVLGLTEIMSVAGTNDWMETGNLNPNIRAETQFNPESDLLPVTLVNGVTSALVVPRGGAISGTSALMRLTGWTWEDMTLKAPVGLHVQWPGAASGRGGYDPRSEEEQKKAREQAVAAIRQAFDDARAYWPARRAEGLSGIPRHDRDVKWEAMGLALRGEFPVFIHAASLAQIKAALEFAGQQGLRRVVLVGGGDAWRLADTLKARDIAVVVGPVLALPRRGYEPYDEAFTVAAKLHAAGVKFCISDGGSPFGASNARNLPYQAAMAAAFGLPKDEALRSITLSPAEILGVDKMVGSLEPGKYADLVIADGDLLEPATHVEQVWVGGRPVSMETRQTRLFQKYDKRPRGAHARMK